MEEVAMQAWNLKVIKPQRLLDAIKHTFEWKTKH